MNPSFSHERTFEGCNRNFESLCIYTIVSGSLAAACIYSNRWWMVWLWAEIMLVCVCVGEGARGKNFSAI